MKQIIVNVSGLTIEEKQRVNEALAKIKGLRMCDPIHWDRVATMYGQSLCGVNVGFDYYKNLNQTQTHTPQQVIEMAAMAKQGHVHADLMALYAEDAKTTDKPWELWQTTTADNPWGDLQRNPAWNPLCLYRRKTKTHIVNGVEVPDLRIDPNEGEEYHLPNPLVAHLFITATCGSETYKYHRVSNNLCYEPTEAGKQAAILHAKAWLGIA